MPQRASLLWYMVKYILLYISRPELVSFMSSYHNGEKKTGKNKKTINTTTPEMRMRNCVHDIHTNIGNSEILDWKDHGFLVSTPQFPVTVPVSEKSCSAPLANSCIGQLITSLRNVCPGVGLLA